MVLVLGGGWNGKPGEVGKGGGGPGEEGRRLYCVAMTREDRLQSCLALCAAVKWSRGNGSGCLGERHSR